MFMHQFHNFTKCTTTHPRMGVSLVFEDYVLRVIERETKKKPTDFGEHTVLPSPNAPAAQRTRAATFLASPGGCPT